MLIAIRHVFHVANKPMKSYLAAFNEAGLQVIVTQNLIVGTARRGCKFFHWLQMLVYIYPQIIWTLLSRLFVARNSSEIANKLVVDQRQINPLKPTETAEGHINPQATSLHDWATDMLHSPNGRFSFGVLHSNSKLSLYMMHDYSNLWQQHNFTSKQICCIF